MLQAVARIEILSMAVMGYNPDAHKRDEAVEPPLTDLTGKRGELQYCSKWAICGREGMLPQPFENDSSPEATTNPADDIWSLRCSRDTLASCGLIRALSLIPGVKVIEENI